MEEAAVKLRRWLILIAALAAVLSTAEVHRLSPNGGTSLPRFRWIDVGFPGTPLYLRAGECSYDWRYIVFLDGRRGGGLKYLDDSAGRRIILGDATDPYDLVPAIWLRRGRP
jgi:hypothetical protein